MILDGHIHIMDGPVRAEAFHRRLEEAGVEGGVVISLPPPAFPAVAKPHPFEARLDSLFAWLGGRPELYAFMWIDPLEADAFEQVAAAAARGVHGFKVICNRFYAGDDRPMEVFRAIAATGRPILFHSGILWDGQDSSRYNRPAEFECLMDVAGLRFALAHLSWPWCDEAIAVYGKFLNAQTRRPELAVEMFLDTTPGTPPIYRREALTRLYTVGYDVAHNVLFGSDSRANDYRPAWVREWIERDTALLGELGLEPASIAAAFEANLRRFLGLTPSEGIERKLPRPGQ